MGAEETFLRAVGLMSPKPKIVAAHEHAFTVPVEWEWDEWAEIGPRRWHVTILRCAMPGCEEEMKRC